MGFKTKGNFVIMVNSSHRSHHIAGELLTRSGRRRGRPWLRAGAVKAAAWLLLASRRGRGRLRRRAGAVKTMAWLLLVSKPSYLA